MKQKWVLDLLNIKELRLKNIGLGFKYSLPKFPLDKENAIRVMTHLPGNVNQPVFPVRKGTTTLFESPNFAKHTEEAFSVANIKVQIGETIPTKDVVVDVIKEHKI